MFNVGIPLGTLGGTEVVDESTRGAAGIGPSHGGQLKALALFVKAEGLHNLNQGR